MNSKDKAQPAFYTVREELLMRPIKLDSPERCCLCGALRESGMKRCHKCRARSRWRRRKSIHKSPQLLDPCRFEAHDKRR